MNTLNSEFDVDWFCLSEFNNKTLILGLSLDCSFGDYYKQVDTSLFSQKQKNSANATPHLVPIMKARIIIGNEILNGFTKDVNANFLIKISY